MYSHTVSHKRTQVLLTLALILLLPCASRQSYAGAQAEPKSAAFKGRLESIGNIRQELSGKTIVLSQPWVTPTSFLIARSAYYFKSNGFVDSEYKIGAPWEVVNENTVCVNWAKPPKSCYSALVDSTGQAYLLSAETKLLFKVESIEDGDALNMKAAYAARQKKLAAMAAEQEQMAYAMLGLLGAIAGFGGGGGFGGDSQNDCTGADMNSPRCKGHTYESKQDTYKPDRSVGCAWGDRSFGTCH